MSLLVTSLQQQYINRHRGNPGPLNRPIESTKELLTEREIQDFKHVSIEAIVGSPERVKNAITAFIKKTGVKKLRIHPFVMAATANRKRDVL